MRWQLLPNFSRIVRPSNLMSAYSRISPVRPSNRLACSMGVTTLTPTAGGGQAAVLGDLRAIAGGMADAGLGANFLLFVNPRQAVTMSVLVTGPQLFEVIPSPSIPAGTVIAVHPDGLATGFGSEPDVDISDNALIHFEDTNPLPISSGGTLAVPVRSAFQSATHVLRLLLDVAFVVRKQGAVQHIVGATW